jgi:ABC-2 type transport system ATP-binding protein
VTPALDLQQVDKRYGDFHAVKDLSFQVEPGSIFGFLGPNGAGKTSTLRMVLGLIPPSSGRISVLGAANPATVRDRIGFLPEERGLYRRMTPVEAVVYFAALKGVPAAQAKRRGIELLEAQGLGEALKRPMKALSKGMAQKVQLVCALAHDPELVILDEPFSGLDPVNQQGLERLIREMADRGSTVIFSTHVMAHAERLCRRIVLLAKGAKVFDGTVREACATAALRLTLEGAITREQALALPGVIAVEAAPHDGGPARLTAELAKGAEPQAALRAAFERGLDLTQFRVETPSLHDAFILLTEGAR